MGRESEASLRRRQGPTLALAAFRRRNGLEPKDDALAATEQDSQPLPFHHGVEAANENCALVAHPSDGIEGLEDGGTGALRGTEEGGLRFVEQL
jgi:hypothetical protein